MPFDGRGFDVGQPSLRTLADVLRDRSRWPEDMRYWDYTESRCCAMEIAHQLWPQVYAAVSWNTPRMFGLRLKDAQAIFGTVHESLRIPKHAVTPEHVADAIDAYLATVPERAVA